MNAGLFPCAAAAALLMSPFAASAAGIPFGAAVKSGVGGNVFAFGHTDDSFSTVVPGTPIAVNETSTSGLSLSSVTFENSEYKLRAELASGDLGLFLKGGDVPDTYYDFFAVSYIVDTLDFSFSDGDSGLVDFDIALDGLVTRGLSPFTSFGIDAAVVISEHDNGTTPFVFQVGGTPSVETGDLVAFDFLQIANDGTFVRYSGAPEDYDDYLESSDIYYIQDEWYGDPSIDVFASPDMSKSVSFTAREDKSYSLVLSLSAYMTAIAAGTEIDIFNSAGIEITGVTGPTGATGSFTSASTLFPGSTNLGATAAVPLPAPLFLLPAGLALLAAVGRRRRT